MNPDAAVLKLIQDVGIVRLCYFDGCICSSFSIKGIDADISCHKSGITHAGQTIKVTSGCMESESYDLLSIAQEIIKQLGVDAWNPRIILDENRE